LGFIKKLKTLLHWREKQKPHITLNSELYTQLRPFSFPLISTVLLMMFGSLGYMAIDNFSLSDAIYQTGITFTTVGFGEIAPISEAGRIFTITLIIVGFIIFSFAIGLLVDTLNKGELQRIFKERRMLHKIARLKNHYVICYHNDYTIQLSKQFRENHIPFVVVDPSPSLEEEAKKYKYPYYVQEEPHTQTALLKSFLSSAKGVITLSDNIADNIAQIASTRLYEKEIGRKRPYFIITTAKSLSDIEKLKKLGANSVISPTKLISQRMTVLSLRPDMENFLEEFLYRKDTALNIVEVTIPKHSWLRFKKLKETHLEDIPQIKIVGYRDKKNSFIPIPPADTILTTDSKLLVVGTNTGIRTLKRVVRKKQQPEELVYV